MALNLAQWEHDDEQSRARAHNAVIASGNFITPDPDQFRAAIKRFALRMAREADTEFARYGGLDMGGKGKTSIEAAAELFEETLECNILFEALQASREERRDV